MADGVLPVSDSSCLVCSKTGELKRCARCKDARYCSKEHQVQHWKLHRLFCKKEGSGDGPKATKSGVSAAPGVPGGKTGAQPAPSPALAALEAALADLQASRKKQKDMEAGEPFDERPLKLCEFEQPESDDDLHKAELLIKCLKKDGFCVIDNVLTEKECSDVLAEIEKLQSSGKMKFGKLAGGQASSSQDDMVVNTKIRGDKMVWLEGKEPEYPAIGHLMAKKMDSFVLPLNVYFNGDIVLSGRTKAMVACYPGEGASYRRHVDNPTQDGRVITCIFYANKDWDVEKNGGVLRIFPESKPGEYVDIAPILNRMIFFWSDGRMPHEVRPAYATRYAITMWYFNAEERALAKQAAVAAELAEAEQGLALITVKTKQVEKDTLEKKVAATTTSAINNLSEKEFEALTCMVRGHPDPKGLLTELGVAKVLQDNLLETIASRQKSDT